ncbi:LysR family transcriptional regulator [filamentous cyanobacterium LEGE 11480]|uniref:LysR family transcriptional regulator n=2 Tax=Romeriopsis TaxID=2992131 RepID=A0A928VNU9_9CYAN|nr:LysR family transcriptional regulator [Romeriopsis navalis LEGE 11480]
MVIFARVVECGSISATAIALDLSKSVVSQHLKSLEQELGVILLNRTTRRQVLTPAGRDFYEQCLRLNSITQQAWDAARETQQLPMGLVSISVPHALIGPIVAPAIGALTAQYERITPTILANDQRINLIEENIDLAIRVGETGVSGDRQVRLGQFRDVLCASPQYIAQHQLTSAVLIDSPERCLQCDYIANDWQGTQITHHAWHKTTRQLITLEFVGNRFVDSLPTVLAMAKAGAGLALIPDFVFNMCQQQRTLANVLPEYEFVRLPVHARHAFGKQPPTVVRLCIEAIKQQIDGFSDGADAD